MSVSKKFMRMPLEQRADIMRAIGDTFRKLDPIKYPSIWENIQNDESRLAVIESIVTEMFGGINNAGLEEALNITEITLED